MYQRTPSRQDLSLNYIKWQFCLEKMFCSWFSRMNPVETDTVETNSQPDGPLGALHGDSDCRPDTCKACSSAISDSLLLYVLAGRCRCCWLLLIVLIPAGEMGKSHPFFWNPAYPCPFVWATPKAAAHLGKAPYEL